MCERENVFIVSDKLLDWEAVQEQEKVRIQIGNFEDFLRKYEKESFNLLIFHGDGFSIQETFQKNAKNPSFIRFLQDTSLKKAAWTLDSHHEWQVEVQLEKYFDTYYVAHANYLDKFPAGKAKWLPCALLFDATRREGIAYSAQETKKTTDVVMVYRSYLGIGDRNAAVWECWKILQRKGYKVRLMQTDQHGRENSMNRYYQALLSGRVILNLSIMDDLNMRNFEALMLNQVMVTNRVPDHEKIGLDYSNVVFFDKFDERSFCEAIEQGMKMSEGNVKQTAGPVLNHDTYLHRFVTMINDQLGLDLKVRNLDIDKEIERAGTLPVQEFEPSAEHGDVVYGEMELGLKAMNTYLGMGQPAKSLKIMLDFLRKYAKPEDWQGRFSDLFITAQQCAGVCQRVDSLEGELLLQTLLEAIHRSMGAGIDAGQFGNLLNSLPQFTDLPHTSLKRLEKSLSQGLQSLSGNLAGQGRLEQAVQCLEKAAELDVSQREQCYLQLAETYRKSGQSEKAMESYQRLLKI